LTTKISNEQIVVLKIITKNLYDRIFCFRVVDLLGFNYLSRPRIFFVLFCFCFISIDLNTV